MVSQSKRLHHNKRLRNRSRKFLESQTQIEKQRRTMNIKTITLLLMVTFAFNVMGCGEESAETNNENGSDATQTASATTNQSGNCEKSAIQAKAGEMQLKDFNAISAYGNYNKTANSYRAMFTNYPKENDSDYKTMEAGEEKVIVAIFSMDGSELQPGKYTLSDPAKSMAVMYYVDGKEHAATAMNNQDIGSVEITHVDDEMLCGTVSIEDSKGLTVKGSFSVKNE